MITVPRTGTRYPTEFRAEIHTGLADSWRRPRSETNTNRHARNSRRDTKGPDAGGTRRRYRRQLPAQQQCGSAATNPMKEAFAGCTTARTRRASFIRPPPVTSRPSLDLAAMTRGDPPRIGRVKRNVRTPPDPGQPTGAAPTETAVTPKARFMPKTVRSGRFGRNHAWCRSPTQAPLRASPIPELAVEQQGFRRVRSSHASPGSVLGAPARGRPRARRQRCMLSRRRALAVRQRRTVGSTRGRWAVTLRPWQFRQDQPDTIGALTRARSPRPGPARRTPRRRTTARTPPSGN